MGCVSEWDVVLLIVKGPVRSPAPRGWPAVLLLDSVRLKGSVPIGHGANFSINHISTYPVLSMSPSSFVTVLGLVGARILGTGLAKTRFCAAGAFFAGRGLQVHSAAERCDALILNRNAKAVRRTLQYAA